MTPGEAINFRLKELGIGPIAPGSVLAIASEEILRGWHLSLDRAARRPERMPSETRIWLNEHLAELAAAPANDSRRSLAAEAEAALRLGWIGEIERVLEKKTPTPDFRVDDVNVEVSCPQEHTNERRVTEVELSTQRAKKTGPVRVAIALTHPITGSGRRVDDDGQIITVPGNQSLEYPANKVIDRVLHTKRDGKQFNDTECNVLWIDLKHGLELRVRDCLPFRSEVTLGTCFVGAFGIWHAFFGEVGGPLFPERTTLEWRGIYRTYQQQQNGWFRELPKVSAAVLSVLDGIILFENPWADTPFETSTRERFARLSEFRPEVSWFGAPESLQQDVESTLAKLRWIASLVSGSSHAVEAST